MGPKLPAPLDLYFAAGSDADPSRIDRCFAPDAVVFDEGKDIAGLPAIKAWRVQTLAKYRFKTEPLSLTSRDGKTIVRCRVTGEFPGSPIELDYVFAIDGGRITSLKIQ